MPGISLNEFSEPTRHASTIRISADPAKAPPVRLGDAPQDPLAGGRVPEVVQRAETRPGALLSWAVSVLATRDGGRLVNVRVRPTKANPARRGRKFDNSLVQLACQAA